MFSTRCLPEGASRDPRARYDVALAELCTHLREHPTVPGDPQDLDAPLKTVFDDSVAVLLPPKHCAFKGCNWHREWADYKKHAGVDRDLEQARVDHLKKEHGDLFQAALPCVPEYQYEEDRLHAIYNDAIAHKVRQGAPLASYSIDRRCIYDYAMCMGDGDVQALV